MSVQRILLYVSVLLAVVTPRVWAQADTPAISDQFDLERRTVSVEGLNIAYYEQGAGRPIVFVHGIPTWSYLWRNVMPAAAQQGRAIALDLPGFGSSDVLPAPTPEDHVRILTGFIDALDLQDVVLVLHDLGAIGLNFAQRHPEKVAGVAFMELPIHEYYSDVPAEDALFPLQAPASFQGFVSMLRDDAQSQAMIVEHNMFLADPLFASIKRPWSDAERAAYQAPFEDRARREAMRHLVSHINLDGLPTSTIELVREQGRWLVESGTPKLAIIGEPGKFLSRGFFDTHGDRMPNLTVAEIGASEHLLMEDRPHEVAATLNIWLSALGHSIQEG